jgi:xanthine dehydrogenase small subunit
LINREEVDTSLPVGTVALDFLRQHRNLPGTKEGCREGECGACTILLGELQNGKVDYKTVASCLLPLGELEGKHIVTVEGINKENGSNGPGPGLTPVQQALTDEGASQCGFCTPGFVVALTGFFIGSKTLDYRDAEDALDGNICRCTGYVPIQRAALNLCATFSPKLAESVDRIRQLVEWSIVPEYFLAVPDKLKGIAVTSRREKRSGVIIAGATDLFVQQPEELLEQELDFISKRKDLKEITQKDNRIVIGAGCTTEEMKQSPLIGTLFPGIREYLNLVSSTIMRNRATLAGNIVNASPIGDLSIMLLALQAELSLANGTTKRTVPLKQFFKGYKQMDLRKREIIEAVSFPRPDRDTRFHFEKVSQRKYLDIAACNSAVSLTTDGTKIGDIHLSAGGVAPVPLYLAGTCAFLKGKEAGKDVIAEALKIMEKEIAPISDVRGSARYKTLLLRNLIAAHFMTLFPDKSAELEEVLS